jgi:molybdenum cofactor biosynthesis enzyme MoaA
MQNTNSCRSCDAVVKTRTVNVLGKELKLKNYVCSADGIHYKQKPEDIQLQLSICPTSFCEATCPFCIAKNTNQKQFVDLVRLEECLKRLHDENLVRGISFTGGEPFTDVKLLNDIINLVYKTFGNSIEVSVTTNGTNLHRMHEIEMLSYLEALHISRHHYDDRINSELFGVRVPTKDELSEILHSVSYKDLFVLNCMLLKDYIGTQEDVHKFLDFAIEVGAGKVAFMACSPINDFAKEQTMDYTTVLRSDDISLLFTRGFQDFDLCRCQDGVYASSTGEIIEFYGRNTSGINCEYCRGFVYGADNHLRVGFNGEIIL